MKPIVEISNLKKRYGRLWAVDGLDLTVERGDVFGFLGPNGAGKSTTIRMMLGLVRPTNGSVRVFEHNVWHERTRALTRVGALVESPGLYKYLTGRQNLWHFASLAGLAKKEAVDLALEKVGLSDRADDKVKGYSHGMRQRLGIAQAIVGEPELVILDEPTNGLDPQGMKEVRELIQKLAAEHQMTIFLSSHLLHEVEQVCSKIAVIHQGKQVAGGSVSELLSNCGQVRIAVNKPVEAANTLDGLDSTKVIEVGPDWIKVQVKDNLTAEVNKRLVTAGFDDSAVVPE
ncbi:MAG TPA: ABC transporter ATP-binding protein, partial [Armatimonadota bacterium]|nr:ABC transporter ATP-binding protein [Armatimonadota bacterium]